MDAIVKFVLLMALGFFLATMGYIGLIYWAFDFLAVIIIIFAGALCVISAAYTIAPK